VQTFAGAAIGGLWLVFIGWFLRTAAVMSWEQHRLSGVLSSILAGRIMTSDPSVVRPELTMQAFVEDRLLREPHQGFPVVDGTGVLGLVTLDHARALPRDAWSATPVAAVMTPARGVSVAPSATLAEVL